MALMSPAASESGWSMEIRSKNKHIGAESSVQASANILRGIGCYKLDEKHIVT